MAIQTVKYGFPFPAWPDAVSGAPGASSIALDADTEKAATIFTASAAKSIRKIHIRTGTVVTGATVDLRVETVDSAANGDPTGTLWATNTNKTLAIANGDDNVWLTATLTADATLAVGDVVALVVANGTGGNLNLRRYGDTSSLFPYVDHFTAAWAKIVGTAEIIPEYSDGSFEPILGGFDFSEPLTATTFATDTATVRRGNIFQLAFPDRAKGCWIWVDADGPFTVKLYDSDGSTVLATTATISEFQRQSNAAGLQFYPFLATASLSAGVNYRIAAVPTSTTDIVVYHFDVPAAGMLDMFPAGQNCHLSTYNGSAWSETTTARMYLGVFLDGFSDSVGGGAHQNNF